MKILFVKGHTAFSNMITNITKEAPSHCALDFGWFVVHSNLLGVHMQWGSTFRKQCDLIYSLERTEEGLFQDLKDMSTLGKVLNKYEFSFYDFGAFLFLGFSLLLRSWLKVPLPKANLWQATGLFLCTEWVSEVVDSEEDSMITPYGLYKKLKNSGKWRDSDDQGTQTQTS